MSILSRLQVQQGEVDIAKEMADYSGSGFINESGMYDVEIKKAFVGESQSGAVYIYVEYDGEGKLENTMYITNKDKQLYYTKDGKQFPMPSYVEVKKINYLLTGEMIKSPAEMRTEERLIKHYEWADDPGDAGRKKRVEKEIQAEVLVDWIGKKITIGVQMAEREEQVKQDGRYVGTGKVATNKDGKPYLEPKIIGYYDYETRQTPAEKLNGKEATQYFKDKERLEKVPVKALKVKPKRQTSQASKPIPKPNIF